MHACMHVCVHARIMCTRMQMCMQVAMAAPLYESESLDALQGRSAPEWLTLEAKELKGTVNRLPAREDVSIPINEAYIVEFSSR